MNLGFLALYTRPGQAASFLSIAGGVLACWLFLRWIGGRGSSPLPLVLGGAAVLALFLLHKLPHAGDRLGLSRAESILAVIGFSYVALRLVEAARAVGDGRHRRPISRRPSTTSCRSTCWRPARSSPTTTSRPSRPCRRR